MSTITDVMKQLESGPKTSGELRKLLGKSSGAISGALWRLTKEKVTKRNGDSMGAPFELTGKKYTVGTRESSAESRKIRRRRHNSSSVAVQATVRIELPGKGPLILTLAEASKLYEALGAVAAQLLGAAK